MQSFGYSQKQCLFKKKREKRFAINHPWFKELTILLLRFFSKCQVLFSIQGCGLLFIDIFGRTLNGDQKQPPFFLRGRALTIVFAVKSALYVISHMCEAHLKNSNVTPHTFKLVALEVLMAFTTHSCHCIHPIHHAACGICGSYNCGFCWKPFSPDSRTCIID